MFKTDDGRAASVLNCDIEGREFEVKSRYYVYFQTNTIEKVMIPFITFPAMGSIVPQL